MPEHHEIIIIGAGLSGLYAAWQLAQRQHDVIVLESRDRAGGRILSLAHDNCGRFDMGPAWIWPQLQPRLQHLLTSLDIDIFSQFTAGDSLYERDPTHIERYRGQSAHSLSFRIAGGSQRLIAALQTCLPTGCIQLNTRVLSIRQQGLSIQARRDDQACEYTADRVILALPPRLIQQHIAFDPALPVDVATAWKAIPTWMAGHCKLIFVYDKPFWREQGLSGEVFSHVGPMSEIYDASPVTEETFGLTAFVGLTAQQRQLVSQTQLIDSCMAQLDRLFGSSSQVVLDVKIKDWSLDQDTATALDLTGPPTHPHYPDAIPRCFWDNKLILAGTETASEHGGYLEGALESAEQAIAAIPVNKP
ncbi:MAG: FAD-dependent oxidoreductase [Gammaproteobacteria bacterium]|jgi:monoamine oxidase